MKLSLLQNGIEEIISLESLKKRLSQGKKLRIKMGADPTKPDLHLGHAVALWKLKEFQDLGHKIIFIIGDYTARIGDPSGRNTQRPTLSASEIKKNAQTYFEQVGKILNIRNTEIRYNSEWLAKLNLEEIINLLSKFTVAGILERDDFQKRLKEHQDIGLHEIIYPILQAYDSVVIKADVEIGGSDQKFNMLAGRELQRKFGQEPQEIITVPLLIGLDGKLKMSKSANNYIGINESPTQMFGKIMSLPDSLILEYFRLAAFKKEKEIKEIEESLKKGVNPRDIKLKLAQEIVALYYNKETAYKEAEEFLRVFSQKEIPQRIPVIRITTSKITLFKLLRACYNPEEKSNSALRRLINQNAVEVNGQTLNNPTHEITVKKEGLTLKVGKREWFKVITQPE